jgi:hypothetical protein
MKSEVKDLFIRIKKHYQSLIMELESIKVSLKSDTISDLVDTVYALREAHKYSDDARKEIERIRFLAAKFACLYCFEHAHDKINTNWCTGTPKETLTFNYPAKRYKDAERYDTLMKALGIPEEVYTQELVRIHWPNFQEYCQKLLAVGKNPPCGIKIDDSNETYDFTIKKKREIDE